MSAKDARRFNYYLTSHNISRPNGLIIDDELYQLFKTISVLTPDDEEVDLKYISRLQLKENAKAFMNDRFRLHKIGHIGKLGYNRILHDKKVKNKRDLADLFNNSIKYIDPFRLPISFEYDEAVKAHLSTQVILPKVPEDVDYVLKKSNVSFEKIYLPKKTTEIAPTIYIHEIAHTQVESVDGAVNDFYLDEVLSIYTELLYAYNVNPKCFRLDVILRCNNVLSNFFSVYLYNSGNIKKNGEDYDEVKYHHDIQYLKSILVAFNLFIKTMYDEKKITKGVQKVFDGEESLDDVLKDENATYKDSLNPEYIKKIYKIIK